MKKLLTLCIIHKNSNVLLGMKKRGFGQGRWNGFGGKVAEHETIEDAAKREVFEETGLLVGDLQRAGVILFEFQDGSQAAEVHVFKGKEFRGEAVESEEMKPQWFRASELPLESMWPADAYWMPLLLSGKKFRGRFVYDRPSTPEHASAIVEKVLEEVKEAQLLSV